VSAALPFDIQPQPDDTTCGPTCLHALYKYFGQQIDLHRLIDEVRSLDDGGTLGVFLALDALRRGYAAKIYTYNLTMFDPAWFRKGAAPLPDKLTRQAQAKGGDKLRVATDGYLEFLERGGELRLRDLTVRLIREHLIRSRPILTGLSATYLYHSPREFGPQCLEDDIRGDPVGHFVVLCGYDRARRQVLVADPLLPNPLSERHIYPVDVERVLGAILLGALTYDANLLIIEPRGARAPKEA